MILQTIEAKLTAAFSPTLLKVLDDSGKHYGHDGAREGHVSHVAIMIVSAAFAGKSRVERTRMAYGAINEEVAEIHAVTALKTLTPDEYEAQKKSA